MSVKELKEKIYKAVDLIEDKEFLETILAMTELPFQKDDEFLTDNELNIVNERREKYLKGEVQAIPWREVQARIKEKYGLLTLPAS